jgi:aminoglycoside phosphotransferase (APT) family kinase protein
VYDVGSGLVLKRYRGPAAAAIAAFEADVMTHATAGGVPVPDVADLHGGDLTMTRVDGPTMLHDLAAHPTRLAGHARLLAELHRIVHAINAPAGLDRPFGSGQTLLHLDLHPDNVILASCGPVIIDWQGAVAGPAAADLAHTWLLLRTSVVPGPMRQRVIGSLGQTLFARAFLRSTGAEAVAAQRILPVVAARRLQDPTLLDSEASRIRRLVDANKGGAKA